MNRTPWYLNERLWAVVAVVGAICCFVSHCNQRANGAEVRTLTIHIENGCPETLVVDLLCDGYPYGQPRVLHHGDRAAWAWRRGVTTITDGERIWGPRPKATRLADGSLLVRLEASP